MTTDQQRERATAFAVSVKHDSGATATVSSDGVDLRLEAVIGSTPYLIAKLGIEWGGELLGPGSVLVSDSRTAIVEDYTAYVGKSTGTHTVRHEEATLALRTPSGRQWFLIVRAAADGFAFRYQLMPEGVVEVELGNELTTFELSPAGRVWTLDYHTWYETVRFGVDTADIAPGEYGFPTLVDQGNGAWILLSESDIDGCSSGAHLVRDSHAAAGALRVAAADVPLAVAPGHRTPWRVIIAGSLGEIVASNLVDDLAPAANPDIPVVARPGRAAWSWWASHHSGSSFEHQKTLVDYAADQGWEYVLVDCGWEAAWIPDLVAYASRRGIQVHIWSLWSDLNGHVNQRKLEHWRSWGVVGVKTDCMESESRDRYRWYDSIMAEAERVGLMLNFHGSVIPRGWTRTHPNVISYEAIRGAEAYIYHGEPLTAAHNVIQPFTRNVVGPMDFTPVTFSAPGRETSDAHELALSVAFESGITHFADALDEYRARPLAARFMATLPPYWHEERLLDGHPDRYVVIARRYNDTWYVAAIGTGGPRTITLDPSVLLDDYSGWLVNDAPGGGLGEQLFDASDGAIEVPMDTNGGFVAVLAPRAEAVTPAQPRPLQPAVVIEPSHALATHADGALLSTEAGADLLPTPGWSLERLDEGLWRARPMKNAAPGAMGIVTAARTAGLEVPVIGHARLFVPLGAGRHPLAELPFLSAHNALGPVGRNRSNGGGGPNDSQVMSVAGSHHTNGLGVSDDSSIKFFIGGQGGTLTTTVGIDDETAGGSARALIALDDVIVEQFIVHAGDAPRTVVVDLGAAAVIELRTEPDPGSSAPGHVDWIDPHIAFGA
ncbi:glycoside hydrolase family 97 catalytic domain-containing protein [Nonomuraea sp. NPDC002799]